ncbi:MAG: hypothetical protein ACTSQY_06180, partial [Candidatus Odinarchaeia archaeon]
EILYLWILITIGLILNGIFGIGIGATAKRTPTWAKAISIVLGILMIIFAIIAIFYPIVLGITLVIFISIALLFAGVDRLIVGFTGHAE